MIRVFHIITKFDVGGAESVAINIAKRKDTDVEQHIVELQRGQSAFTKSIIKELKAEEIPYHRSWLPVWWHLHYYTDRLVSLLFPLRMLWLWMRYRPDVIHSHTEMPDMAVWLSLRLFPFIKVRVVRTIHNTNLWTGMEMIGPRVEQFMQMRNANIAISQGVMEAYRERFGVSAPIIYNGVEVPEKVDKVHTTSLPIHILFAGRFEEQKGIATLCDVIERLKDDERYFFHVHGSGRLQSLVNQRLKLLANVEVGTPITGLANKMQYYDYMIMPSLHEGLSIVAIEASMNGLPLLINDCMGLSDTLPDGWPLKVYNNEINQWLHLFRDVLPVVERKLLIAEARNFAEQHFALNIMQDEYLRIYKI